MLLAAIFAAASLWAEGGAVVEGAVVEGIASWYGAEFAGRPTASGERFDPSKLTAAHRSLPFGTLLKVSNLYNGKSVVVRVNDRGPFVTGRVLDVSRAAAELLDMISTGTAPIKAEIVAGTETPPTQTNAAGNGDARVPEGAGGRDSAGPASGTRVAEAVAKEPAAAPEEAEAAAPTSGSVASPASTAGSGTSGLADEGLHASGTASAPDADGGSRATASAVPAAPAAPAAATRTARSGAAILMPAAPRPGDGAKYRIQVGSYRMNRYAEEAFRTLVAAGFPAAYETAGPFTRVVIPNLSAEAVLAAAATLGAAGFPEVLVRLEVGNGAAGKE